MLPILLLVESEVELGKVLKGIEELLREESELKIDKNQQKNYECYRDGNSDSLNVKCE